MKGLMICVLATIEVLGVIYVMDGHRRGARHFLRGSLSLHDGWEPPKGRVASWHTSRDAGVDACNCKVIPNGAR